MTFSENRLSRMAQVLVRYSLEVQAGQLVAVMAGIALGARLQGKRIVALTYIGDGGMSTGAFHEGFNFAAVQKLPLVLIAENNGWAYSTPYRKQTAARCLADKAQAYGVPGESVDGNDVLAVYEVTREAIERARRGQGPTLIEADTMRMRGHAEHDDMKYVPRQMLEEWARKDPLLRYEAHLLGQGIASKDELAAVVASIETSLREDLAFAEASPFPEPESAMSGVHADRPVAPPTPPLVREWERRKGAR